mgnify:CR=1 FL=1
MLINCEVDGFVCEVQIRQRAIHAFAKEAQSHEHYEFFRSCARAAPIQRKTAPVSAVRNMNSADVMRRRRDSGIMFALRIHARRPVLAMLRMPVTSYARGRCKMDAEARGCGR